MRNAYRTVQPDVPSRNRPCHTEGIMAELYDWSAAVFLIIQGRDGVVAVRKRNKDGTWGPWHLAGGKREPFELAVGETARREVWEETGLNVRGIPFVILDQMPRVTHKRRHGQRKREKHFYELFFGTLTIESCDIAALRSTDPHEQVRFFTFAEYRRMKNFLGLHRRFIKKHGLVPASKKTS